MGLYPVINQNDIHNRKYMAQYYRLNYKSPLALGSYFKKNLSPKRRPNFVEMLFYDARYSKNKDIWQPDSFSNGLAYTANNMRGPKKLVRQNKWRKSVHLCIFCWMLDQTPTTRLWLRYPFSPLGRLGKNREWGLYWNRRRIKRKNSCRSRAMET